LDEGSSGESDDNVSKLEKGLLLAFEEQENMHHSEGSDRSHETGDKDVEDDEDPRPAKRQKQRSAPAYKGLTPQPQNLTPPSATQLEATLLKSQVE
jgi:hypothetical protein